MIQVPRQVSICQICGQLANGNHFGVISCRACAAFFRRANLETDTYCVLGNCQIHKNGRFYCKKCRLRKCLEMGMDVNKFQHDRDLISTSTSSPESSDSSGPIMKVKKRKTQGIPLSLASFLGRPAFILSCEPERACRVKTVIDVTFLINQAMDILKNGDTKRYFGRDSLENMSLKLQELKKTKTNLKLLKVLGLKETMFFWEQSFLSTATWLTHFEEFQQLPLNVKMQILKVSWILWARLDKLSRTADERRRKTFGDSVYMIGEDVFLDVKDFEVDVSWCTNYSKEQLVYYLDCHHDEYFNKIVDLLIDLNPRDIELNYMLIEICLHYAGKKHQGDVLKFTDKLMEVISDNLHNYYQSERISNYSSRLVKMMKIDNLIRRNLFERLERQEVAKVFNIMSVHFSHPDMFSDSGF
ncbi:CRE-NHR-56 protein [Caenorhabditis remanei]|uniref:CRE-NHR-56 protein n=1 Tax=Caenorhabditis remanei TaxID=31234 RepID=E3LHC3_CAERE|nr:CRE-NHR-56 protein [Caenorhabditis remanei]